MVERARAPRASLVVRLVLGVGALLALSLPTASAMAGQVGAQPEGDRPVEITLYWDEDCRYCDAEWEWLAEVGQDYDLVITELEIKGSEANRERLETLGREFDFNPLPPVTVIDGRVWVGFTDTHVEDLLGAIELAAAGEPVPPGVFGRAGAGTCAPEDLVCEPGDTGVRTIDVPLFGEISLSGRSLLVTTLIIGFVDGVNPCSLWVISVLLTIVVRTASRRRVVAIGSTFLLVTAAMYALYMTGIYAAMTVAGFLGAVQIVVAVAAGIFGIVSIKDYFAFKQGISFTISDSAKPGIYQRMRRAAAHHKLVPALMATVALGVAVSLLETPCTAGFPVIWTGMLQANNVSFAEAAGLFVAYMIPFLLDEMIVFGAAVATMRAAKLQEKHGELLKLFAGVTMVVLAAVMALDPSMMESPVAAMSLFVAAFAAAWLVHLVTGRVRRNRGRPAPVEV